MTDEEDQVRAAFLDTHKGFSTDAVLADDARLAAFRRRVLERVPGGDAEELTWLLLNLRKRSEIGRITTCKQRFDHAAYEHAAEIAARRVEDRHGFTLDRALACDSPRRDFDRFAAGYSDAVDPTLLRLAALSLRKARRLAPEGFKRLLSGTDRPRVLGELEASAVHADPTLVPMAPGIYLLLDAGLGLLYVGEAGNLRKRVAGHLEFSDRKALAHHFFANGLANGRLELHTFEPDSAARRRDFRRSYENFLIQSRQPLFNLQGMVRKTGRSRRSTGG